MNLKQDEDPLGAASNAQLIYDDVLSFRSKMLDIEHWKMTLEVNGEIMDFDAAGPKSEGDNPLSLSCSFSVAGVAGPKVDWTIRFTVQADGVIVDSSIVNRTATPVRLGKMSVLVADDIRFGADGADIVVLPSLNGPPFSYCVGDPALPVLAKTYAQFYDRKNSEAVQLGFLTFQRANTEVAYGISRTSEHNRNARDDGPAGLSEGQAKVSSLWAYCDFGQWELQPGAETQSETFRLAVNTGPFEQLESWAHEAGERVGAQIWAEAPIGYVGGSWTDRPDGATTYEAAAIDALDAINERLAGYGVKYLWTSMSNFEGSLPGNWLQWNDRAIPSGREEFLRNVTTRGFVPGFWIAPFYISAGVPELASRFSGALLSDHDGSPRVIRPTWSFGDAALIERKDRAAIYAMDPSHPIALEFIRDVFEQYREWGIRYYMVDFLAAGAGNINSMGSHIDDSHGDIFDKSLVPGPEVYTSFLRVMQKAAGADTYILSSSGPKYHNAGLVSAARVGNDFGEGRPPSPGTFFYPATYVINRLEFWSGPSQALAFHAANYHTHRQLYLNDSANVLTVDQPLPITHAQIAATIHAFSGGGTMLGDDIRNISEQRLSLIKKTLPRSHDIAKPLDLFSATHPAGPRTFWRHVSKADGSYEVVAMYNLSGGHVVMSVDLGSLGLSRDQSCHLWDFWNEQFLGDVTGEIHITVPPESVKVLRITPTTSGPSVIGTDMHILMGEVEIVDSKYDPDTMALMLTASRTAGDTGTVFIWAPDDFYIRNFDKLHIAKDFDRDCLIISVPLHFDEDGRASRTICFGTTEDTAHITGDGNE